MGRPENQSSRRQELCREREGEIGWNTQWVVREGSERARREH